MEKEKCQICGKYTLDVRECILCGKKVCPKCFRLAMGACRMCIPGPERKYYETLKKYAS